MYTKPLKNRKVIDSSTNPDIDWILAATRIPTGFPSEQRGWRVCAQHWLSSQRQRPPNACGCRNKRTFIIPGNSGKSTWLLAENSTSSVAGHKKNISCRLCECFRQPGCSSWCSKFPHNFAKQIKVVGLILALLDHEFLKRRWWFHGFWVLFGDFSLSTLKG